MKLLTLAFITLFAIQASADFPYDFQGNWMIASFWGFPDQSNIFCPRATFDMNLQKGILFSYEYINQNKYEVLQNRSYYSYGADVLTDTFTPYAWTWDILYSNGDNSIIVLGQNDKERGMVLFRTFELDSSLVSVITNIVKSLNVNIISKMSFYPAVSCQQDGIKTDKNFDPSMMTGTFWFAGTFGDLDRKCETVSISWETDINSLYINWPSGKYAQLLAHPNDKGFLIDNIDKGGAWAANVIYSDPDFQYFTYIYTTDNYGFIFSKERSLDEDVVQKIEKAYYNMGYSLKRGENFHIYDNSDCDSYQVQVEKFLLNREGALN